MRRYIALIVVLLSACVAKKQAAEFEAQPAWMKQKPIITGYYVGIGSAKKVGPSSEYIANARKDALADLAGEVSVQISSNSVYRTIEDKYGHLETYDQRIETTVDDYLEGFEPVEIYENTESYWVYYKISKATYAEKKEMNKQEALMTALAKYNSGFQEEEAGNPKEALAFYLQGLQSLKPYLKEETTVISNETKIDIGNRLFSSMDQLVTELTIAAELKEIKVRRGEPFDQSLKFRVLFNHQPARSIPVEFTYTGGYFKNDRQITDGEGYATLHPEVIYSKNKQEQITAGINLKEIASKSVEDTFIRGLVLKKSIQPAVVFVNIDAPSVSFNISENCCLGNECSRLTQIFNQNATSAGFVFDNNIPSDFTFHLNYSVSPGISAGGLVSSEIKGVLNLTDKTNKQLWTKEISGIRGVGSDNVKARQEAFSDFLNSINRIYIRQGLDKINSN